MLRELTLHKINANFPKVRFTYIILTQNFLKQCAPNFILREFLAIYKLLNIKVTMQWEDGQVMEILRTKTEEVSYALRKTDQYEDQSKDILNQFLKKNWQIVTQRH